MAEKTLQLKPDEPEEILNLFPHLRKVWNEKCMNKIQLLWGFICNPGKDGKITLNMSRRENKGYNKITGKALVDDRLAEEEIRNNHKHLSNIPTDELHKYVK